MGWHAVGRALVLSRLGIRREGVVRGPARRGRLDETVVEGDLRVVVRDCRGLWVRCRAPWKTLARPSPCPSAPTLTCHPGKLVAAEGTTGERRAQAAQCPPDLQLHPGHSCSVPCWPEGAGGGVSVHVTTGGGRVGAAEKGQDHPGPGVSVREAGCQNVYFRGSLGPRSKIHTIEPEIQTCHRGQQSFKSQIDLGSSSGSGFTCPGLSLLIC